MGVNGARGSSKRTRPMDSPSRNTTAWSATVPGLVRKKKPRVMWKRQREVRIVLAEMSGMVVVVSSSKGGGTVVGGFGVCWLG